MSGRGGVSGEKRKEMGSLDGCVCVCVCVIIPLPAFSKNGTPAHRSFSICPTAAQKVAHRESSGTSSSSLKAGFVPSSDLPYWPMMVSLWSIGSIQSKTRACKRCKQGCLSLHHVKKGSRTFSAHKSSAEKDFGRSIVSSASIWVRSNGTVREGMFEGGVIFTILHHVSDGSYAVEIAASTFCSSSFCH